MNLISQPQEIHYIKNRTIKLSHIKLGENLLGKQAQNNFLSFYSLPSGDENIIFECDESL